jgi:RNA polymerase sigma factor (sigma-70 family)
VGETADAGLSHAGGRITTQPAPTGPRFVGYLAKKVSLSGDKADNAYMEAHSFARSDGGLALPRSRKLLAAFGDERLVAQVRRGNDNAFEVLYDRHHTAVLSYCRHMLGSRDEAEDALQQAFVSAHGDIVSSDKPIRFKAWIYAIARNRCLSILRARREVPSDDLERVSTAGLGEEVQQRADLKELLADMQELPEDQRTALILSELGDLSHAEVAEIVECEVAKVKSLVFQARSGLIERRQARETPCQEIREQLATLRGGALRRGPLRRHVKACPGCAEFRDDVRRQRKMVAAVLPVVPTLGLKESALAAVGVSATTAGGGAPAGGGAGALFAAKAGVAKLAVVAVATTGAAGGAVAVKETVGDGGSHRGGVQQSEGGAPADSGSSPVSRQEAAAPTRERRATSDEQRDGDEAAKGKQAEGKNGV